MAIGQVLSSERVTRDGESFLEVKVDLGGDNIMTAQDYSTSDFRPLPGDYASISPEETTYSNKGVAVGYLDAVNVGLSLPGESRAYARNAANEIVATIALKTTGEVQITNDAATVEFTPEGIMRLTNSGGGEFVIGADGTITINGVTFPAGTPDVIAGAVSLTKHVHPVTAAPGTTDPPIGGG